MPREDRTGQHGPEMDDTQVEATDALHDELPPVEQPGHDDEGAQSEQGA